MALEKRNLLEKMVLRSTLLLRLFQFGSLCISVLLMVYLDSVVSNSLESVSIETTATPMQLVLGMASAKRKRKREGP